MAAGVPLSGRFYLFNRAQQVALGGYQSGDRVERDGVVWVSQVANNMVAPDYGPNWALYS